MERRVVSGRGQPIPSILKKSKKFVSGDLLDKSTKIKREKFNSTKEDINTPLPQGCTPLMYACQQANYKSVVDTLNKDPSSVRVRDRGLRCALHYCASSGAGASQAARAACADRVLMAAPALADARDSDGLTPLHLAVVHGNVPLVQTLLAAGADVNAKDNEQHTVVHWATVCGEVGALRAVLAAGANAVTADQHGGYPLHYAAQMCGAPAATDHQSRGAALEVLRALVKEGSARIDVRDADGRTPLLWAASAGSAAAVLALHQAGASVDDSDRDGLTALHCAAARGHTEALETLLGLCGARVDVADSHGCTPLHYASALGHADATSALLTHGADPHRQDRRGRSPAHTAAAKGQIETIRILGAKGANLWLRNSKGDLPLHEAVASGRRELLKWLLDGRPSQVNATNHEGRTPLHVAAATDNADLCRLLLDRGAEINPVARSSKNEPLTPLDCAASRGHRSTAKYLQMHGGLPASKLTNTQIIIDNAQIIGLPSRKVTSTKIDVRDRIRIEKREILELSSPIMNKKKTISNDNYYSSSSSSASEYEKVKKSKKKHNNKYSKSKKFIKKQKSFSDGYDSEFEIHTYKERKHKMKNDLRPRKSRSKSEPSGRGKSSPKHCRRDTTSYSESSSEASSYYREKKNKRRRKRTKRKSMSSSSYESISQQNRKKDGRKTSIHIENDETKQKVNIVKYNNVKQQQHNEQVAGVEDIGSTKNSSDKSTASVKDVIKSKHSETETDTISVKANMVTTEAQIHMERDSIQRGSSELTVTMDSLNNVSIETANLNVTHKEVSEEFMQDNKNNTTYKGTDENSKNVSKEETPNINNVKTDEIIAKTIEEESQEFISETKIDEKENIKNGEETQDILNNTLDVKYEMPLNDLDKDSVIIEKDINTKVSNDVEENKLIANNQNNSSETARSASFQVLSGPDKSTGTKNEILVDLVTGKKDHASSVDKNSPSVSFSNKDEVFKINETVIDSEQIVGVNNHDHAGAVQNGNDEIIQESRKRDVKEIIMTSASETSQIPDKGIISILDDTLFGESGLQEGSSLDESKECNNDGPQVQTSPCRISKFSKDSQASSRKSSIYETESYKVLSDTGENVDLSSGILKKSKSLIDEPHISERLRRDSSFGRIPSISDNEIYYSHSEVDGRRKRFRKKGKTKSRMTIRSKSENSERGYESSGLLDSGFEPSPRPVQRCIMSPRLNAYYQQRKSARITGRSDSKIPVRKPGDKRAVDMKSVTQRIQTNMRRYYCERKIFQHLLELKRLQIRTSKANEAVLVKRAIDEYNKSSLANVGLGYYNSTEYSFSSFEKFLYDSLRKLQKSGKMHLDKLPEKPIDFDYGESDLYKMSSIPDNPCLCTSKTHRCFHAVHAYTGIPCSAYIPYKWNHHTMPKPVTAGTSKSKGFLPKINSKPPSGKAHVTLEVSHGTEKQLIALPAERLDRHKRYYVTFTVKGSEPPSDNDASPKLSRDVRSLD